MSSDVMRISNVRIGDGAEVYIAVSDWSVVMTLERHDTDATRKRLRWLEIGTSGVLYIMVYYTR